MTNEQFRVILAMIVQIIKDNRKEEAIQKIEAILASSFRSLQSLRGRYKQGIVLPVRAFNIANSMRLKKEKETRNTAL